MPRSVTRCGYPPSKRLKQREASRTPAPECGTLSMSGVSSPGTQKRSAARWGPDTPDAGPQGRCGPPASRMRSSRALKAPPPSHAQQPRGKPLPRLTSKAMPARAAESTASTDETETAGESAHRDRSSRTPAASPDHAYSAADSSPYLLRAPVAVMPSDHAMTSHEAPTSRASRTCSSKCRSSSDI